MGRAIKASESGLKPHYKVRVVIPGAILHIASWDEPHQEPVDPHMRFTGPKKWVADWIKDGEYGDTIGFIDWSEVRAITWRWSELWRAEYRLGRQFFCTASSMSARRRSGW